MKKIFILLAAMLASLSLSAQTFVFSDSNLPEGWTANSKGSSSFSDDVSCLKISNGGDITYTFSEAVTLASIDFVFSFGSKTAGLSVDVVARDANGTELKKVALTQAEQQTGSNVKQEASLEFNQAGVKSIYIKNETGKNLLLGSITFNTGSGTEPSLKASVESVDLFVTPSKANPSVQVTFSGKNLTPGNYSLTIPNLAGLTVAPQSVTVDEDGKLSAEVTISYTSAVDVAIASVEISLTINEQVAKVTVNYGAMSAYCGELIRATHTGKTTADVTGLVGGTVDKNTEGGGKLGSNDHYFGIKLADGNFQEGDVLTIHATTVSTIVQIFSDKGETMLNEGTFDENGIYTYELAAETEWIYLYRTSTAGKTMNPVVDYMAVSRDCSAEPKLAVSPDFVRLKVTADESSVSEKVTFSGKNLTPGTYNLTLTSVAGLSVNPTSVTVPEGGKLSAEVTLTYTSAEDVMADDAELSLTIGELSAAVSIEYIAKVTKQYATSLNIEQLVLDNGKSASAELALEDANIDYENIDALDSLDASKDFNNYPYLGLKMKKNVDAMLGFWLKAGSTVNVRMGNIPGDFTIKVGEQEEQGTADLANKQIADTAVWSYTAGGADVYIQFLCNNAKAFVFKQIMINEDIQPVNVDPGVDPSKDSDATIKSLSINGVAITREGLVYAYEVPADENLAEVEVVYELNSDKATGSPATGFKVAVPAAGAPANEQALIVTAESGDKVEYTISVTRAASPEEGLFDLDTTVPATKLIRNGQLLIIKNNRTFTVLGQEL